MIHPTLLDVIAFGGVEGSAELIRLAGKWARRWFAFDSRERALNTYHDWVAEASRWLGPPSSVIWTIPAEPHVHRVEWAKRLRIMQKGRGVSVWVYPTVAAIDAVHLDSWIGISDADAGDWNE